ncbi:unnamed protein product, partial [Meganyctiphanes norvegica]
HSLYWTSALMARVVLFVLVVVAAASVIVESVPQFGPSDDCERWCSRLGQPGQYDCCVHSGTCPPCRKQCPPSVFALAKPEICYDDSSCARSSKCCCDTCLGHKTCKPAQ